MPKEELAGHRKGSENSPRISRFTGTTELLTIPSELFLRHKTIFRIFEIVFNFFYIRISAISKRLYFIELCLFIPQRTFDNPLRAMLSKIGITPTTAKFSSIHAGASRGPPRQGQNPTVCPNQQHFACSGNQLQGKIK